MLSKSLYHIPVCTTSSLSGQTAELSPVKSARENCEGKTFSSKSKCYAVFGVCNNPFTLSIDAYEFS